MASLRLRAGTVLLATALGLTFTTPAGASGDPSWSWNPPQCDTVYGDGSVTFTQSDGAELAPSKGTLQPATYGKVAALEEPNTLISIGRQAEER